MEVVPLRTRPIVVDIPGQLRQLADRIEAAEVKTEAVLCIVDLTDGPFDYYAWGENCDTPYYVAMLAEAQVRFLAIWRASWGE